MAICTIHGEVEHYTSQGRTRCKKCNVIAVQQRRSKVLEQLKTESGAKCNECGYSVCLAALEFHHRNPAEKNFQLSSGNTRSLAKMREESKKCVLLCANCHREVHAGIRSLSSNR